MKLFINRLLAIMLALVVLSSIPLSLSIGDLYINVGEPTGQLSDLCKFFTSKYIVDVYTLLDKNASTIDLESTIWIDLGRNYNTDINGSFSLKLNSSTVQGEGLLSGYIVYSNNTMNLPNIEGAIEVNGVVRGSRREVVIDTIVNGTTSIDMNGVVQKIDYYLPIENVAKVFEKEKLVVSNTSIVNGYVVLSGNRLNVVYNRVQKVFLNKSKVEVETSLKLYGSDMITLYMVKQMLSTYLNVILEGPNYDPKTGKYYISYHDKEVYTIEEGLLTIHTSGVDVEDIDGEFHLKANYSGGGSIVAVEFEASGYFTAVGDFSKGFIIDEKKSITLRSINVQGEVYVKENSIIVRIDLHGEYTSLNLYLIQYSYRELVPSIIGNSEEGGKAVLESSREDIWFLLDNKTYTRLVFVPENASLASNLYIVVNGTVLESNNPWGESINYRVISSTDIAEVYVFNETTKEILVNASKAREVVVFGKNIGLTGKYIEVVYGKYRRVAVLFPEDLERAPKAARVKILGKLPKPLPKNIVNVSGVYDISVEASVKTKVRIWYDPSSVPEKARLYIAHYSEGSWKLLEPDLINSEEGYVEVVVESFSPFTVVAVPGKVEETTTTTSKPTATQTTTVSTTETSEKTTLTTQKSIESTTTIRYTTTSETSPTTTPAQVINTIASTTTTSPIITKSRTEVTGEFTNTTQYIVMAFAIVVLGGLLLLLFRKSR